MKEKVIKANINADEEYPAFYVIAEGQRWFDQTDKIFNIREDKYQWIKKTTEEYYKVQTYLRKKYGWDDE